MSKAASTPGSNGGDQRNAKFAPTPGRGIAGSAQKLPSSVTLSRHMHDPGVVVEHDPIGQLRMGLVFGSGPGAISWRDSSGEIREEHLTGPQLYVVPPLIAHSTCWTGKSELLFVGIEAGAWQQLAKHEVTGITIVKAAQPDPLRWKFAVLCRDVHQSGERAGPQLADLVGSALACQVGKLLAAPLPAPDRPAVRHLNEEQWNRVLSYMLANLKYDIHVDDLAKQLGLGTAYFTELFTNTAARSPFQYLKDLRMLRAHSLMVTTGLSSKEIAPLVGYSNTDHFAEVFRKFWGRPVRELLAAAHDASAIRPA